MNLSPQLALTCWAVPTATPYLSLDEVVALCPDMLQEAQDIDCAFVFYLLQHAVYYDVGACPAHTSTGRDEGTQLVLLATDQKKKCKLMPEEISHVAQPTTSDTGCSYR